MIYISNKIQDAKAAQAEWLRQRLFLDEMNLPDYPRPLKKITTKSVGPFGKLVTKYGFAGAALRFIAP